MQPFFLLTGMTIIMPNSILPRSAGFISCKLLKKETP
jgi:hypothetical protein